MTQSVILASASPRRKELLWQLGIEVIIHPVDIDESPLDTESPLAYVQRVAAGKSARCRQIVRTELPVLAADTAVVIDGRILGKPKDKADFAEMMTILSGRQHIVLSAVSLEGKRRQMAVSQTEVLFRTITIDEIETYWSIGEPVDKAGGYAIQGLGGIFVESIVGSYSGVVGLPLFETAQLLKNEGINPLTHE